MRMLPNALLALLLLAAPAQAQDFARTTAATQLVDLMNQLDPFDDTLRQSAILSVAPLLSNLPCPEKALPAIEKSIAGIRFATIRPALITAYAETFDYNELNVIRAFYQTPAGTRLLKLQPRLSAVVQQEVGKKMQGKLDQLAKDITTLAKDKTCQAAVKSEEKVTP